MEQKGYKSDTKVFCIGLSRTGTTSLCAALDIIGVRSQHFLPALFVQQDFIFNKSYKPKIKLTRYWNSLRSKEERMLRRIELQKTFKQYSAFGDLPIPNFYKELDKMYPDSKFIYTTREKTKWLKSMKWLMDEGQILWNSGFINKEMRLATYGSYNYDEQKLSKAFDQHHCDVLEYFKEREGDLLTINIDEEKLTFEKLCLFLKLPIPSESFPKVNQPIKPSFCKILDYKLSYSIPYYLSLKKGLWKIIK